MKHNHLITAFTTILALGLFLSAGCEEDAEDVVSASELIGSWSMTGVTAGSVTMTTAQLASLAGGTASITVTYSVDNTLSASVTTTVSGSTSTDTVTGTCTTSGSQLTVNIEGVTQTVTYNVSGSTLSLTMTASAVSTLLADVISDLDPLTAALVTGFLSSGNVVLTFTNL